MSDRQAMSGSTPAQNRASLRTKVAAVLACAAGGLPFTAHALPVIPQGAGYGVDTPAGRGGVVHKVTNLNASGAGSLKACVDATGPRVCVFEVSGTIRTTQDLVIHNPRITIAGQTAPSPGIMMRGGAVWVAASDVLIQHLRFRAGDDLVGPDPENRDALKIDSPLDRPISNVVIDHCSFSWAIDETASVWKGWDNVTLSNNIFSEGLRESLSPIGAQGYGVIVGPWQGRISLLGNLLAHNYSRNPLSRASQMLFVNNVVYASGYLDVDLQSEGLVTNNTIVGNVFIRGPASNYSDRPVHIRNTGSWPVPVNSKVYVADNAALEATADPWSVVDATGGTVPNAFKAKTPPVWPSGMTRMPIAENVTLEHVLRRAGARSADRDTVDRRVVQQVRDRTGQLINCVSANGTARCSRNAGGWPTMAENRRVLTLPQNPQGVTASGYTNLEIWLHEMSAQVEGRSARLPVPPVLANDR